MAADPEFAAEAGPDAAAVAAEEADWAGDMVTVVAEAAADDEEAAPVVSCAAAAVVVMSSAAVSVFGVSV